MRNDSQIYLRCADCGAYVNDSEQDAHACAQPVFNDAAYALPEDLFADGKAAAAVIMDFLQSRDLLHAGGQRVFWSPGAWKARGEQYGHNALLIVCHDGGDHALAFNEDYEHYRTCADMVAALARAGFYHEPCTGWYTAVYNKEAEEHGD
jgi:hypothetical protein